jgi:hypothetical protein
MNGELERMWEKEQSWPTSRAYSSIFLEDWDRSQNSSVKLVSKLKFEMGTSRTQARGVTMYNLRISQQWLWRIIYPGIYCTVDCWKSTDILEEHLPPSSESKDKQRRLLAWLILWPWNVGDIFLQKVDQILMDHPALYPWRQNSGPLILSSITGFLCYCI